MNASEARSGEGCGFGMPSIVKGRAGRVDSRSWRQNHGVTVAKRKPGSGEDAKGEAGYQVRQTLAEM